MDKNDIIFRLQVMTMLDSMSYGLLYCFISPYLIKMGGDQVTIGIFTAATLIFQLMSIHIVRDMVNLQGQKTALYTIFNIAAICHVLLFATSSNCFIIMARCIFSCTNQSTNLIKNCLEKNIPPERRDYHMNIYTVMNSSGFIIGPMVTGALYDTSFAISCSLASLLTIINIWLLTTIPGVDNYYSESSNVPAIKRVRQSVERRIDEIKHSNYRNNWDVLAIQYLFSTCVITFSTKYSAVLKHNYQSDHTEIGWVTSYMNVVIYAAIYISCHLKKRMEEFPPALILNLMFSLLVASSTLGLYAPVLALYCLMCIPITLARMAIMDNWDRFASERQNHNLNKACDSVNIFAGLTVPLVYGFIANRIDHHTTVIFSVCPVIMILLVINHYTMLRGQYDGWCEQHSCAALQTQEEACEEHNCPAMSCQEEEACEQSTCPGQRKRK